uniref:ARID domain-containing protein n=1 Tax=Rhabditophanes sp. KR3021 TaxID=114890 RepID=A0AC35TJY9_9BILA
MDTFSNKDSCCSDQGYESKPDDIVANDDATTEREDIALFNPNMEVVAEPKITTLKKAGDGTNNNITSFTVKNKIDDELRNWLVNTETMNGNYEQDHDGWHRFPFSRLAIPADLEYMENLTGDAFLDKVFKKHKQHINAADWRQLPLYVKKQYRINGESSEYITKFPLNIHELNTENAKEWVLETLQKIRSIEQSNNRCYLNSLIDYYTCFDNLPLPIGDNKSRNMS